MQMQGSVNAAELSIRPWSIADFDLLRRANAPEMMLHLGGPESDEQVLIRHQRYLDVSEAETGAMFSIRLLPGGEPVGIAGYWERSWAGQAIYETGWSVLPSFQRMGIAAAGAKAAVASARSAGKHTHIHAFPSVDNVASNAICRSLNFELMGECDFEYPPGHPTKSHDWRLDLTGTA